MKLQVYLLLVKAVENGNLCFMRKPQATAKSVTSAANDTQTEDLQNVTSSPNSVGL